MNRKLRGKKRWFDDIGPEVVVALAMGVPSLEANALVRLIEANCPPACM